MPWILPHRCNSLQFARSPNQLRELRHLTKLQWKWNTHTHTHGVQTSTEAPVWYELSFWITAKHTHFWYMILFQCDWFTVCVWRYQTTNMAPTFSSPHTSHTHIGRRTRRRDTCHGGTERLQRNWTFIVALKLHSLVNIALWHILCQLRLSFGQTQCLWMHACVCVSECVCAHVFKNAVVVTVQQLARYWSLFTYKWIPHQP